MSHAIRIHAYGGPEVLQWEHVDEPRAGAGEAVVRHSAIGLNYIDTYHRTGFYPFPLPGVPGMEAAAVVEAVGDGVTEVAVGDRVAYTGGPTGAYAERRAIDAAHLVPLPDDISDEVAAAGLLKGLTAHYLVTRTYPVRSGDVVLVHAAAGGVGALLAQWAHGLGATVIGTVGSDEKAEYARARGCDHPVVYTREDVVEAVRRLTGGAGVAVVYDSVGASTFESSLDCLRPLGTLVSYGQSSGAVPPLDVGVLARKGSLFLTRPTLFTHIGSRAALLSSAEELFGALRSGLIAVDVGQRFALRDAAAAHRALESRQTRGSTLLIP